MTPPSPLFPLLGLAIVTLALPLATAASEPLPTIDAPSVWRDGAWLPVAAAPTAEETERATASLRAAAAATNEGSQILSFWPVLHSDGSVERALFGALVDGESCLWSTDGTSVGTFRVEPTGECVPLRWDHPFVGAAHGVAYFVAGTSTYRLWRSDGTPAGTWPLMGFDDPGLWHRRSNWIPAAPGLILLVADDGVHGLELWVSDGTPESAERLGFVPGLTGTLPFRFQVLGSEIFFFVGRGGFAYELWKTDGTSEGTAMVEVVGSEDFHAGPSSAYPLDGRLVFFLQGAGDCWVELWTSDGTAAGTVPLRQFTGSDCPFSGTFRATRLEGTTDHILFATADGEAGVELWRTDGTAAGTFALSDLAPAQPFARQFPLVSPPVVLGSEMFFRADGGDGHGSELWKSDGTPGGATLVADLCPGACSSNPGPLSLVGEHLVFSAENATAGRELWMSDGTAAGTVQVADLCPGTCGTNIFREVVFGSSLLFIADDGSHGEQWWRFTPPAGPAVRLTDLAPVTPFGAFLAIQPFAGRAVFVADDGMHGREPWVTDGTPAGTHLLVDLQSGDSVPLPEPPIAPANLQIEKLPGGWVRLTWEDRSDNETAFALDIVHPWSSIWTPSIVVGPNVTSREVPLNPGTTRFRVRSRNGEVQSPPSNEVSVTFAGVCVPDAETLCLGDGRFAVSVRWRNQHAGPGDPSEGRGQAVAAGDGVDDSGSFWFFTPDNLELVVKVLDGTTVNGHFWVFWGGLSDVEYWIEVENLAANGSKSYYNPPGEICGGSDTAAFPGPGSGILPPATAHHGLPQRTVVASPAPFAVAHGPATRFLAIDAPDSVSSPLHPPQPCVPDDETLCLLDGELAVTVDWTDQHNGGSGTGHAVPYSDLTGFFWFFHPENVELIVKALDGRTVNGKIWVFYSGLSDVGYSIRVAADAAHQVRTYDNPPGTMCGQGDTAAF